jgi:hypothetical protein
LSPRIFIDQNSQLTGSPPLLILPPVDLPPSPPSASEEWVCGTPDLTVRGGFEDLCPEFRDTAHFRIHYATEGRHRFPGWPDPAQLDRLATILEEAVTFFHESLDLPMPASDGTLGGGEGLIDCYCWDYDQDRRFWAGFARHLDSADTECDFSMYGLMSLNVSSMMNRTTGYIQKIAAHEVFHLVQYGIAGYHDDWFAESTAEWAAGRLSPSNPIYLNTYWFLVTPQYPLYTWGSRMYGARLFWDALDRLVAPDFAADIVRATCTEYEVDALKADLQSRGSDLTEILSRFAEWNAFTGSRDDGQHYAKGETLTAVRLQAEHTAFPVLHATLDSTLLAGNTGSNYIRFIGPGKRSGLRIEIQGAAGITTRRIICALAKDAHGQVRVADTEPDANGFATLTIPNWSEVDDLTLIVTNGFPEESWEDDLRFTYSAIPTDGPFPTLELGGNTLLAVFPNPAPGTSTIQFQVSQPGETNLAVYDVAGRRILDLANGNLEPGVYRSQFDVPTESGIPPSAGVYFIRLETGGKTMTEKVTVLRAR